MVSNGIALQVKYDDIGIHWIFIGYHFICVSITTHTHTQRCIEMLKMPWPRLTDTFAPAKYVCASGCQASVGMCWTRTWRNTPTTSFHQWWSNLRCSPRFLHFGSSRIMISSIKIKAKKSETTWDPWEFIGFSSSSCRSSCGRRISCVPCFSHRSSETYSPCWPPTWPVDISRFQMSGTQWSNIKIYEWYYRWMDGWMDR